MIYSIKGMLTARQAHYAVLEANGIGFKVSVNRRTAEALPPLGSEAFLFCHLHSSENGVDLYGLLSEDELSFFEQLISVSGVGPKSALAILDVAELKKLLAAIKEGRPDLLTQASGIGRKTGERIILELKNKVELQESKEELARMESEQDLLEVLVSLGYRREEAKAALLRAKEGKTSEERLKEALKLLAKRS